MDVEALFCGQKLHRMKPILKNVFEGRFLHNFMYPHKSTLFDFTSLSQKVLKFIIYF